MSPVKRWKVAPPQPGAPDLARRLKASPVLAQVLLSRGIEQYDDCQQFLQPSLKMLHEPAGIANLTRAAERIAQAIAKRQKVVIYGDYDVDGITATAILWHAIRTLGGRVEYYIPHRLEEGYGLNAEAVEQLCAQGAELIVSVDCGVTAIEPAAAAARHGVDLIITDHHEWRTEADAPLLPECFAVVHPRLPGDGSPYPNAALCGAGVAYKLAWGIGLAVSGAIRVSESFRAFLLEATALAALGTIADVVPLVGENRVLAHFGLVGIPRSRLVGLQALIDSAGLGGQAVDSYDVGFKLAPRLNASGRMGHASLAVEMLTVATPERSIEIATFLEQQNRARQATERQILEEASKQVIERGQDRDGNCAIVLGSEAWHPGVIGIVASRLVERFHRPTVLVALQNGYGQGSARSIRGFHLARAFDHCSEHLVSHGGHEMAAGLKLSTDRFEQFREQFCEFSNRTITPEMLQPELRLDAEAALGDITPALVTDLRRLGPFGQSNPRPLLCCRNLEVTGPSRRCGRANDHLQFTVRQGNTWTRCIAFGKGELQGAIQAGSRVDLAAEATLNEYQGRQSAELEVKDIQFAAISAK